MIQQLQPSIFKTIAVTASGNTDVWKPSPNKKFRLMGYQITITGNSTISGGGILDIKFVDNSTDVGISISTYCPASAATTNVGGFTTGWNDLRNGYISLLADNTLKLNLSATVTGKVLVNVCGIEE